MKQVEKARLAATTKGLGAYMLAFCRWLVLAVALGGACGVVGAGGGGASMRR